MSCATLVLCKYFGHKKSKSKKFKNDINKKEDMTYNTEDDYYICAYGILLFTYSFFFCFTLTSPAKPTVPKL